MSIWITVDEAYVLGAMPGTLRTAYNTWILSHPTKAGRLAAVISGIVADFREGLRREAVETLSGNAAALPERCVRHAAAFVYFHIGVEMDAAQVDSRPGRGIFSILPEDSETGAGTVFNVAVNERGDDSDRIREYELARSFLRRLYAGPTCPGSPKYRGPVARKARGFREQ